MTFDSIDKLQNILAKDVFNYTKDPKKASGRALGTIVEIISFYLLESWGFSKHVEIEKGLIEYGNPSISHNVEYTLHPIKNSYSVALTQPFLPITASKILRLLPQLNNRQYKIKNNCLLTSRKVLRNSCLIGLVDDASLLATIEKMNSTMVDISVTEQYSKPFAMVECKRVGVEEGMKKGPQTIEKAKQGAYVAKTVSSLQKIRNDDGTLYGVIPKGKNTFYTRPYDDLIKEVISSNDPALYKDFILTIGVASNHGNWFTSDDPNKELLVLAESYDWLIFLTDKGICEFICELLIDPKKEYELTRKIFLSSYQNRTTKNQFTKVQMQYDAHVLLLDYFKKNKQRIEKWFSVITPKNFSLSDLQEQLKLLAEKRWDRAL
jgi:hypothetical protein